MSTLKNPFVGLRAFEEDEDYLFFGRSAEISDLLKKFSSSRFLAVIGSSGSGKSSLVKSGLMPAIYSGFLSAGHNWRAAIMKPGNDPIGRLANALAADSFLFEKEDSSDVHFNLQIEAALRRSGNGLIQVYKQARLPQTDCLLIVVDQFEELFRFNRDEKQANEGKSDALNFINLLLTATQQTEYPIYVLLTMRSDFLGDCAQFRGLPEAINAGQYLVPRMTRDEIREAIKAPIAVGGAEITLRLITRLLNDVSNDIDQLPKMQHAMMRTWNYWEKKNTPEVPIDIDDYDNDTVGGMTNALSLHANEIFEELDDKQQNICMLMFKALTDKAADVRGIRRPKKVANLSVLAAATPKEIINVVEVFRKEGRTFLTPFLPEELDETSIIDISHESLMRVWDKLITWTEEEAVSADVYKRLAEDAKREASAAGGSLLTDLDLKNALEWKNKFGGNDKLIRIWAESFDANFDQAMTFLNKSEAKAIEIREKEEREIREKEEREAGERRKKRKNAIIAIVFLSLFSIVAGVLYVKSEISKGEAIEAKKDAVKAKDAAVKAKIKAEASDRVAKSEATKAKLQEAIAKTQEGIAKKAAHDADSSANVAKLKTIEALAAEADAKKSRDESLKKSREIALNEYLRLIREGPSNKKNPQQDTFDYKLIEYAGHVDILDTSKKFSWNKELYDQLFLCLKSNNAESSVFTSKLDEAYPENNLLEENVAVDLSETNLLKIVDLKSNSLIDSISVSKSSKSKLISAYINRSDHLIICATEDNMIMVFPYTVNNKLTRKKVQIPMGSRVTALDYDAPNNIIYFGLKGGEIGFIKYNTDKKNQPVFVNTLRTEVSAVDFFNYDKNDYFLSTAKSGEAVVFKLDGAHPAPDKSLQGIELPDNKESITAARFDEVKKCIQLKMNNSVYYWNPFVKEVQQKLKEVLEKNLASRKINPTVIKKECKFY